MSQEDFDKEFESLKHKDSDAESMESDWRKDCIVSEYIGKLLYCMIPLYAREFMVWKCEHETLCEV